MISVTLLILQIVGLLTYPAVLASIFSGKNIIKYIADMKCDQIDQTCEKMKSYKWEILAVMIFYLVAIVLFSIAIYYQNKGKKVFNTLVLFGSICSFIGVGLIVHMIFSVSSEVKKDGGGDSTKFLWFANALTLIFSLITAVSGSYSSIKGLRKP